MLSHVVEVAGRHPVAEAGAALTTTAGVRGGAQTVADPIIRQFRITEALRRRDREHESGRFRRVVDKAFDRFHPEPSEPDQIDPLHMVISMSLGLAKDHYQQAKQIQDAERLFWLRDELEAIIAVLQTASNCAARRVDEILRDRP